MKHDGFSKYAEVDNKRHAILAYVKDHPDSNLRHIAWGIQHPYETIWGHVRELVKMGCLTHVRKGMSFHYQVTGVPYIKERKPCGVKPGIAKELPEQINPHARVIRLMDRKVPPPERSKKGRAYGSSSMALFDTF